MEKLNLFLAFIQILSSALCSIQLQFRGKDKGFDDCIHHFFLHLFV